MWHTLTSLSLNNYKGILNINERYIFDCDSMFEVQYTPFCRSTLKSTVVIKDGIKYDIGICNDTIKQIICKDINFQIDGYKIGDSIIEITNEIRSIANPRLDMRYGAYMKIKDNWYAHFDVTNYKITHFVKYFSEITDIKTRNKTYFDTIPLTDTSINTYVIIVHKDYSIFYKKADIINLLSDLYVDNPDYLQYLHERLTNNNAIIVNIYNSESPYYYLKSPYSFWEYFILYRIFTVLHDAELFSVKPH